jgi:hypothetical protein
MQELNYDVNEEEEYYDDANDQLNFEDDLEINGGDFD